MDREREVWCCCCGSKVINRVYGDEKQPAWILSLSIPSRNRSLRSRACWSPRSRKCPCLSPWCPFSSFSLLFTSKLWCWLCRWVGVHLSIIGLAVNSMAKRVYFLVCAWWSSWPVLFDWGLWTETNMFNLLQGEGRAKSIEVMGTKGEG